MEVPFYLTDGQTSGRGGNELAVSIKVTAFQSKSTGKPDPLEQNNRRDRSARDASTLTDLWFNHNVEVSARVRMRMGARSPSWPRTLRTLMRHVSTEVA